MLPAQHHQAPPPPPTSQVQSGRITFTNQNGTINLAAASHSGNHAGSTTIISTAQLPQTTTIKTITSAGTTGTTHHGITQQGNQAILNSMIPANVVLGMRPPNAQQAQQQKTVQANTLSRVVIGGSHMVGARPQSPAITLSTLTPGQTPALLVKTENGYQLLRVGSATTAGPVAQTIQTNQTTTNQQPQTTQIRLQTVPAAASQQTTATIQQQQQIQQQTQHLQPHPQITQIQTIPASQSIHPQPQQPQQQQQQQQQQTNLNNNNNTTINQGQTQQQQSSAGTTSGTGTGTSTAQGNSKEKCRKFLANLIDLSTREPKPVEKNVRSLIQELVNANVEPEEFCDKLERLLNASPQPCLIGFLKRSLPLLRQALFTKELVIEGIKPPPQSVAMQPLNLPKIQAQIRPVGQQGPGNNTTTIGQTQVRMITPGVTSTTIAARPIGQTTITKQANATTTGIRIQQAGAINGPRILNAQAVRAPGILQGQGNQQTNVVQIRGPAPTISRPSPVAIRSTKGKGTPSPAGALKVGQTQIKAISSTTPANSTTTLVSAAASGPSSALSIISTINSVASNNALPVPSLPTVQLPPGVGSAATADIKIEAKVKVETGATNVTPKPAKAAASATSKASAKRKRDQLEKDKDDKASANSAMNGGATPGANANSSSFFQQPSLSMSSSLYGDDDINDVAAMGGVNLAEESQRILGSTENIGTQIRSCKDEVFLSMPTLQARIRKICEEQGMEEPAQDVAILLSHATQEYIKSKIEKLTVISEHRTEVIKLDSRYEVEKDIRGQIKFLEELDKAEQKRHEELEREMLLRAAKSRSRTEDPEQAKMKAKAKEMQRAEMEELRQRDANLTALQAIGPRKKIKLENESIVGSVMASGLSTLNSTGSPLRPRIKRVNMRDMLFYLEHEREYCRSELLYKIYLK